MPYIKKENREKYKKFQEALKYDTEIKTKGELEYLIFLVMVAYMKSKPKKYSELHDTVYAAMHCSDEFRHRFLDRREDEARDENGDIEI